MLSDNLKFIIGILAGIGIIVGFVWAAQPSPSANSDASALIGRLTPEERSYDFGTISMAKGKVSHTFKVQNATNESIPVSKVYTSCMCTQVTLIKGEEKWGPFGMPSHVAIPRINQVIAPGETVELKAVFDPAAHGPAGVGNIERTVFLETDDIKILQLNFKANVTP